MPHIQQGVYYYLLFIYTMQNIHVFKIKYLGATNTLGSRIKITSERHQQSVIIAFDYTYNNIVDGAADYLRNAGFNMIGSGEGKANDYILSDTFANLK